MLMELNISKGLPHCMEILVGGKNHVQRLDYRKVLFRSAKCHIYGHLMEDCSRTFLKKY